MQSEEIVIKNLNLSLQNKSIISNLNLKLEKSEIHTIIGLSGAGKSQLLRTMIGLNLSHPKVELNKKMRIVFQENNLIPWLSLKRNVEITSQVSGDKIDEMFEQLDIAKFKNYKPHQISGGMQQRVSIIRALVDDCDLLLLDEPFSKLDAVNKQINYDFLLKLWQKTQPTILMVTHDLDEAIFFSQRISFFSKTEKTITHTEKVNFPYPRSSVEIKKQQQYFDIYNKFSQLLQEDFKRASLG